MSGNNPSRGGKRSAKRSGPARRMDAPPPQHQSASVPVVRSAQVPVRAVHQPPATLNVSQLPANTPPGNIVYVVPVARDPNEQKAAAFSIGFFGTVGVMTAGIIFLLAFAAGAAVLVHLSNQRERAQEAAAKATQTRAEQQAEIERDIQHRHMLASLVQNVELRSTVISNSSASISVKNNSGQPIANLGVNVVADGYDAPIAAVEFGDIAAGDTKTNLIQVQNIRDLIKSAKPRLRVAHLNGTDLSEPGK